MTAPTRRGYGLRLAAYVAALFLVGGTAVAVLLRTKPAFQVVVFGTARADAGAVSAAEIRPAGWLGMRWGKMGSLLTGELLAGQPGTPYPGWTEAGLNVADSRTLGEARRLSGEQDWTGALAAYDRLLAANPANDVIAVERARVLSWSGDNAAAGAALAVVSTRRPSDEALRLEAARYYWWAAKAEEADSLTGEALALRPDDRAADSLRNVVRSSSSPSISTARRWLRQRNGPVENLQLARALAREKEYADALPHYRAAIARRASPDSVVLEYAGTALAADSPTVAASAFRTYLRDHPRDRETRIALARALSWAKDYDAALPVYADLLDGRDDAALRYELAEAQAWSGHETEAIASLRRIVSTDTANANAWRLLGDLSRWHGEWAGAQEGYRHAAALDPQMDGIWTALAEVGREREAARIAMLPPRVEEGRVEVESFGDTQGFRNTVARGVRTWQPAWGTVEVAVERQQVSGDVPNTWEGDASGYAISAHAERELRPGLTAGASAGASEYPDQGLVPTWGADVSIGRRDGVGLSVEYVRQPAFRRVSTMASLDAEGTSDLLRASGYRPLGRWSAWSQAEVERLHAKLGTTGRLGASLGLSRQVTKEVGVAFAATAIAARGDAPALPGGPALWWVPEYYVEPSVRVSYGRSLGRRWIVGGSAAPGLAFVRERQGALRRFPSSTFPTVDVGLNARYTYGRWSVGGAGSWNGAVGSGYRSAAIQLSGGYVVQVKR
ncbi:MAG TPA: tetratricopeptide repeat protein [Longimicrobiaceae bacterium]|jgi:thioredoxin-like negative regulator of GroEL|nr:tetratricopeptide repeat protein [Longimicrobiaceae bacterium]